MGRQVGWRGLSVAARLDKYSIPEPNTGCWLWTGSLTAKLYGKLKVDGKVIGAHRLQWIRYNGPILEGMSVLHKCDMGLCINPEHLFLGTQADNLRDAAYKGRTYHPNGEANPQAKLSEVQVRQIFKDNNKGVVIAGKYGVSTTTIYAIKTGGLWGYLNLVAGKQSHQGNNHEMD